MPSEHVIRRRVEFVETDMAGIVHFSRYFNYMEQAEHDFFRSLGLSVVTELDGRRLGWPRVHAEADWRSPLRFEDRFDITLLVREVRSKAIVYDFVFHRIEHDKHGCNGECDGGERTLVGHGSMTTVCVVADSAGHAHAVEIPRAIRSCIEPASPDRIAAFFPTRAD